MYTAENNRLTVYFYLKKNKLAWQLEILSSMH